VNGQTTLHYENINYVGNEVKVDPLKDFLTVNVTGRGHEAKNLCKVCDDNDCGGVLTPPSGSTIVLLLNFLTLEVMAVHFSGTSVDIHQSTKN